MTLWNWFVPTVFLEASQLDMLSSADIYLAVVCLTKPGIRYKCLEWYDTGPEEGFLDRILEHFQYGIVAPLSCLFAGWIVYCI